MKKILLSSLLALGLIGCAKISQPIQTLKKDTYPKLDEVSKKL